MTREELRKEFKNAIGLDSTDCAIYKRWLEGKVLKLANQKEEVDCPYCAGATFEGLKSKQQKQVSDEEIDNYIYNKSVEYADGSDWTKNAELVSTVLNDFAKWMREQLNK